MGRGQGKSTDLGNNGRSSLPWTWTATAFDASARPAEWGSSEHGYRVATSEGGRFVVVAPDGQRLKGEGGRIRVFQGSTGARTAANVAAGIMQ